MPEYAWYEIVRRDVIEQGDMLRNCRVYFPPDDLSVAGIQEGQPAVEFEWAERDVIVMSQTCDMVKGREKVREVLLCAYWTCEEIGGHLASPRGKEDARRGNLPGYHMLASCNLPGFASDVVVVDFRRLYSLPLSHFRSLTTGADVRIRLLPPYREHLAQAFARYFMRVGLPVDIPAFH
ncbi:MAG: hypothetical protein ABI614_10100 [Planctomycetota bacterium]